MGDVNGVVISEVLEVQENEVSDSEREKMLKRKAQIEAELMKLETGELGVLLEKMEPIFNWIPNVALEINQMDRILRLNRSIVFTQFWKFDLSIAHAVFCFQCSNDYIFIKVTPLRMTTWLSYMWKLVRG